MTLRIQKLSAINLNRVSMQGMETERSLVYLGIRLILGLVFLYHGLGKIGSKFAPWEKYLSGFGYGNVWALVAAVSELLVAGCLLAGFFTRVAAVLGIIFMVFALFIADKHARFAGDDGSNYQIGIILLLFVLLASGPGDYSIDRRLHLPLA